MIKVDRKKVVSGETHIFFYYKTLNFKLRFEDRMIKSYTEILDFVNAHIANFDFISNKY